ncbi:MAG: phage head closure protein [Sporolactobacillus sp.]
MPVILDPSRLNRRIQFGTAEPVEQPNGATKDEFVGQQEVYCGRWTRTFNQSFQVIGTERQDDITVIIRHNPSVTDSLLAQFIDDTTIYKVIANNPDESTEIIAYDLVTLRKVSR